LKILKKAKLDPEDTAERGKLTPTADLASRLREAQAEVVRISKISSSLQGPMQRVLRAAASLTMGLTDVLRTRADAANGQTGQDNDPEELRRLVADLQKEQEKSGADIALRGEMAQAKVAAETADKKVEMIKRDLQDSIRKNQELKQLLKEEKSRVEALKAELSSRKVPQGSEPMEVEVVPHTPKQIGGRPSPRVRVTQRDLED